MKWPAWRYEKHLGWQEAEEVDKKVSAARAEAVEALSESYQQLEHVRQLNKEHEPVRKKLRPIRDRNGFSEAFLRFIEEGR